MVPRRSSQHTTLQSNVPPSYGPTCPPISPSHDPRYSYLCRFTALETCRPLHARTCRKSLLWLTWECVATLVSRRHPDGSTCNTHPIAPNRSEYIPLLPTELDATFKLDARHTPGARPPLHRTLFTRPVAALIPLEAWTAGRTLDWTAATFPAAASSSANIVPIAPIVPGI